MSETNKKQKEISIIDKFSDKEDKSSKSNIEIIKKDDKILDKKDDKNIESGSNDLFFEKFNRSKKDFNKDKKEKKYSAKKKLSSQYKAQDFSRKLEDNSYLLKIYSLLFLVFFICVGFSIAIFVLFLPISSHSFYDSSNVTDIWERVSYVQYPHFAMTMVVFSSFIFILLPAPYLYLVATWFVGINQVKRSKTFVLLNIYLSIFAIVSFVVILILSSIFFAAISAPIIQYPAIPLPTE